MGISISAFFPAYNDGGTIPSMVMVTDRILRKLADDYEIIVVNDGSTDHTADMLEELQIHYPNLRVIDHVKNRGYGGALRSGFTNSTKEWVFYTDGDAQYDAREIVQLIGQMRDGIDAINGYKIQRHDPPIRIVIGRLYHNAVKLAFGLKIREVDCDFRLMRRKIFDVVQLQSNSGVICVELVKKTQDAGFNFVEVPVNHFHRAYGRSQFFNFARVSAVGLALFKLWWELVVQKKHRKAARPATVPSSQQP
jgi:glycosyltransferase involved in cell wall biosynthesis